MAFGFGFNKQKVLSAAEKFVQQGKLPNAISEYEKVLKADAKDLTVMNTVGDLYSRLGESEKAAECFKNVGDAYASQGFTVKAIAMYKKLGKLKSTTESVLRLAELYTQQGLFNDARAQYLHVAEDFLKSGKTDQAIRIFQKTLEMDPENVQMRMRLAEAYVRMDKKDEAWKLLSTAAEALRSKGQLAAANEILQRMLKLDPGNSYALVLRGRSSVEAGDFPAAIECLSKVPDLDSNVEGLRALFQAYLQTKRFTDASALVTKLANVHDDISAVFEYGNALIEAQQYGTAVQVYTDFADQLLRSDSAKLFESIRAVLGYVKDDPQVLEKILAIFQKGGDTTQFTDIYELLAHGYVQSGDLEKAREYYSKLMQLEPANQMHASNYQQIAEKAGNGSAQELITPEEGASLVDELEANAPAVEQRYDDDVALAIKAALTDAELFISYNMPAKALDPLIKALPKAPRDLRLNQRLAALHTRAGRFAEAAVCCRTVESIYHDAGFADEASKYSDLAVKYEQRSSLPGTSAATIPSPAPASVPAVHAAPVAVQEFEISAPAPEHAGEVDQHTAASEPAVASPSGVFFGGMAASAATEEFSVAPPPDAAAEQETANGWEQDFSVEAPAEHTSPLQPDEVSASPEQAESIEPAAAQAVTAPAPLSNLEESIEEVRFYLGQGMTLQAEQLLEKLEGLAPGAPELAVLRFGIDSAKQLGVQPAEPAVSLDDASDNAAEAASQETVESLPTAVAHPQPWPVHQAHSTPAVPEAQISDQHLDVPAHAEEVQKKPEPAAAHAQFSPGTLDAFVADLEASLGSDFVGQEEAAEPAPAPAAAAAPSIHIPVAAQPLSKSQPVIANVHAQSEVPAVRAAAASASGAQNVAVQPVMPPVPAAPQKVDPALTVDLSSMFGELKQELEHDAGSADEDPETHYNLGVAFREMGLLDEAIGELQKVCQYIDHGHSFPHVIQAYTWLAQCFLDKGVPEVAARWYEKALKIPKLDQEARTALHYELASSLESAGNKPAALSNFLEVYSSNIDYRDVAERIKALRS
jgi:tetratricopeptide (TPR) repeat protein